MDPLMKKDAACQTYVPSPDEVKALYSRYCCSSPNDPEWNAEMVDQLRGLIQDDVRACRSYPKLPGPFIHNMIVSIVAELCGVSIPTRTVTFEEDSPALETIPVIERLLSSDLPDIDNTLAEKESTAIAALQTLKQQ